LLNILGMDKDDGGRRRLRGVLIQLFSATTAWTFSFARQAKHQWARRHGRAARTRFHAQRRSLWRDMEGELAAFGLSRSRYEP